MKFEYKDYKASAALLKEKLGSFKPEVLMVLGSGLGFMGDLVENPIYVNYKSISNLRVSTAPGHKGRFIFGTLCGKNVCVMQGRMHTYEGYSLEEVAYPVRVARLIGAKSMIVTNAAGAINKDFKPGDLMLITDHIKMCLDSPLTGQNVREFGDRFPDMSNVYSERLRYIARTSADSMGIELHEGVYIFFPGPQFETPAEIRAARLLGADASGMSTVPEAIVANQCGMEILGITLCTNMAAGILDKPLSGEEVNEMAEQSSAKFSALIEEILRRM